MARAKPMRTTLTFLLSDPLQAAAQLALELVVLLVWVVLLLLYRC